MHLVCLGDSLTLGYGVASQYRWTTLAAGALGCSVRNYGIAGDTAAGMLVRLQRHLLPRYVSEGHWRSDAKILIMGGSNDIFFSGSDVSARSSMFAMLKELNRVGTALIIGLPLPTVPELMPRQWAEITAGKDVNNKLAAYCDWLRAFCQSFNLPCIDFRSDFICADGCAIPELFLDGVHPSSEGHILMARRLTTAIGEIIR